MSDRVPASSGPCSIVCSSNVSTACAELVDLLGQLLGQLGVGLGLEQLDHGPGVAQPARDVRLGPIQVFSPLISCTTCRASSALDQNAGSACRASKLGQPVRFLSRSKKTPDLGDTLLQVIQLFDRSFMGMCLRIQVVASER